MISFLLLTSMAFAQSVDGEWTTSLRTREPDRQIITITLMSDGKKVTGTIHGFSPIPLEGSIEGNALKMILRVPTTTGGQTPVKYIAILEGDELKFTYQSENGRPSPPFGPAAREFTARRAK